MSSLNQNTHTQTQLCCDALYGETVKVKLDPFILLLKMLQLARNVCSLINVGIRTVLIMELPVAITLLLGSIPNSVHFQLQSRV